MGTIDETTRDIIARIEKLPAVSPHTIQIVRMAADPAFELHDLAELVSMDITLAATCLKLVNSAQFGLKRQISSVEQAVAFLGSREILNMTITSSLGDVFDRPLEGYSSESGDLWMHSLRTAIASSMVAAAVFPGTASTSAYTAGLLHDIGKVALSDSLTPYSSEIIAGLGKGENGDFAGSERRVLHMDHAEAGWLLAQQWNIPDSICAVVRYHHAPENAPEEHRELCIAVHIGDILAMLGGYGTGADTLSYRIDPLAEEVLRHHNDTVVKLMLNIEGEFVKSQRRLRELSGEKHV